MFNKLLILLCLITTANAQLIINGGGGSSSSGGITNGASFDGSGATNLNGSSISSGNIALARLTNASPSLSIAGSQLTGTVGTARLGSGSADNTTFLRGDQTWAVPSGGSSLVLTNVVFVSPNGSDSTGARANAGLPFLTCRSALSNALAGDTIIVYPGVYTGAANMNMGVNAADNGINWFGYPGAVLSNGGSLSANDAIFKDGGSAKTYNVGGYFKMYMNNTGGNVTFSVISTSATTSDMYIEGDSMSITAGGGSDCVLGRCDGGKQRIKMANQVTDTQGTAYYTQTSGTANQTVESPSIVATGQTACFCLAGKQVIKCSYIAGLQPFACQGSGTQQIIECGEATPTSGWAARCNVGNQRGIIRVVSGTSSVGAYCISGNQNLYIQDMALTGTAVQNDGGTQVITIDQSTTAAKQVLMNGGATTINGAILAGNSASGAIQFSADTTAETLTLNNCRISNADATGPVVSHLGSNKTNIFMGAGVLVGSGTQAINSTNATSNVVLIYGGLAGNFTNTTLTTISTGTFTQSAAVK